MKKSFVIDFHRLGLKVADLLIKISKEDREAIVSEIVKQRSKCILEITIRLGQPDINLMAELPTRTTTRYMKLYAHLTRLII